MPMSHIAGESGLSVLQRWGDRIDIHRPRGQSEGLAAVSYRHARVLPKPCVHPLSTPRGHVISGFEMSDHVWHRGLWFAIKFINGSNFWEERAPFGTQTSHVQPICEMLSGDSARIIHQLDWTSDATGTIAHEDRQLHFHQVDGFDAIDWTSEIRFSADVTLDRTPFTTWGGYGGLSFRATRAWHKASLLGSDGQSSAMLAGQRLEWLIMSGLMDNGVNQQVSLAMIDHPTNPRSPSPWYAKTADVCFMNAAFLFHEPMQVKREDPLRFRYRVLWRDGTWTKDAFVRLAEAFRSATTDQ
jgi:Methane oxygenase PmoA